MTKTFRSGCVAAATDVALMAAPARAQNSLGVVPGFNIANLTFDPPVSRVDADAFGFDARAALA